MREAYRLQKNELRNKLSADKKSMVVFFIYSGKQLPEQNILYEKISSVLKKLVNECSS